MNEEQKEKTLGNILLDVLHEGLPPRTWTKDLLVWEAAAQAVISAYRSKMNEGWRLVLSEKQFPYLGLKEGDQFFYERSREWRELQFSGQFVILPEGVKVHSTVLVRRRCLLGDDFVDKDMYGKVMVNPDYEKASETTMLYHPAIVDKASGPEGPPSSPQSETISTLQQRVKFLEGRHEEEFAEIERLEGKLRFFQEHYKTALDQIVELEHWKRGQMQVDSSWDCQEVAKEMRLPAGQEIRPHVLPYIQMMKTKLANAETVEVMLKRNLDSVATRLANQSDTIILLRSDIAKHQSTEPPWIPCSEKMPEDGEVVLWIDISRPEKPIWFESSREVHFWKATHWMRPPALPQPKDPHQEVEQLQTLYNELLYAVAQKHKGETRHETALRYIRERESLTPTGACSDSSNTAATLNQKKP